MIKDLVVGFRKAQQQFPSIIQDNYKLKEGIYIRLNPEQTWEEQSATIEENHLIIRAKEDAPQNGELLEWFKRRDYYSSLIAMQKPVDKKKQVHSNNPYSLFVKQDVFFEDKQDVKFTMIENIDRYLLATDVEQVRQKWLELIPSMKRKGGKGKGKLTKDVDQVLDGFPAGLDSFRGSDYAEALAYLNNPIRLRLIESISQWYRANLEQITKYITEQSFKKYIKLFFAVDASVSSNCPTCEQLYSFEYELYTIPKIYNQNNYNQIVNEELVGLPSLDMSMNAEKPFMEHKTMRIEAPDRVSLKEALLTKEVSEWLATRSNSEMDRFCCESGFIPPKVGSEDYPEGTFHVYWNAKDNEIQAFENVPFPPTLSFDIEWQNCLQLKDRDGNLKNYRPIDNVETLQKVISERLFCGQMKGSFILNKPNVKDKEFTAAMVALYLQSRQAFYDWFYKGTTISIRSIFAKVTLRMLEEQLIHVKNSWLEDLKDAFNLRLSIEVLIDGKGGRNMADRIVITVTSLRKKLAGEGIVVCSNDDEFYFMAGQLAYYLISRSDADKKNGEMFEPFLRAKNGQRLKKRLEETYMLYKHEILLVYRKFNHAFSMVMGYVPEQENEGSSRELLLAGLFADNLLYEKSVKEVE
ncbi:MAG TPA: hypothetical protein VFC58_09290 [Desulfosporosinus sp.]|nr:hypothetical protein [Desulfosporosinus sp.]